MADRSMPSDALLAGDDSVLVVVDIQGKLLEAMPQVAAQAMLENAGKLLAAAALLKIPVLLTEQYPKGLGPTAEAVDKALPDGTQRYAKTAFSCCGCGEFNQALAETGRRQVILVGQEAHVCVLQTAVDLQRQGLAAHVVEDGVCSRSDQHKDNALARLRQLGVSVSNHESVLFEWLRDARHPDFKTISALLR